MGETMPLTLKVHAQEDLSICKLPLSAPVPTEVLSHHFTTFARSEDEATLICPTNLAPSDVQKESGWIRLELIGPFAFGLTGILTQIANPLAAAGVSITALATFNTDHVLIKAADLTTATTALLEAGHSISAPVSVPASSGGPIPPIV
jgi:uncharacterized protein